jgi:hypothetical protein
MLGKRRHVGHHISLPRVHVNRQPRKMVTEEMTPESFWWSAKICTTEEPGQ